MSGRKLELVVDSEDLEAMHHLARKIVGAQERGEVFQGLLPDAVELARLVENALEEPAR